MLSNSQNQAGGGNGGRASRPSDRRRNGVRRMWGRGSHAVQGAGKVPRVGNQTKSVARRSIRCRWHLGLTQFHAASIIDSAKPFTPYHPRPDSASRSGATPDRSLGLSYGASRRHRYSSWAAYKWLVFKEDEEALLERARDFAREHAVFLVMGTATIDPGVAFPVNDHAVLIDPAGQIVIPSSAQVFAINTSGFARK